MDCVDLHEYGQSIKSIGEGGYGEVFLAEDDQHDIVAVKTLRDVNKILYMEYATQAAVHSPYTMPIRKVVKTEGISIIMDLAPIALRSIINKHTTFNDRLSVARKILEGILCIHQNGIIHCDLKPSNIQLRLVNRGDTTILEPVIIDFGLALPVISVKTGKTKPNMRGTRSYFPPELLMAKGKYVYTEKMDIWSYGIIVLILFTGRGLYPRKLTRKGSTELKDYIHSITKNGSVKDYIREVMNLQKGITIPKRDTEAILNFVNLALTISPNERPSAQMLLQSPLFNRIHTPIEICATNAVIWPPQKNITEKTLNFMKIAVRVIVRCFKEFQLFRDGDEYTLDEVSLYIFYWAMDLMYMYFSHPLVVVEKMALNRCIAYAITCVVVVFHMDDMDVKDDFVNTFIELQKKEATGTQVINLELIESLQEEMVVTLGGRLWRRFMYESIRTKEDVTQSFTILYNPLKYMEYVPKKTTDPINEMEPHFLVNYYTNQIPPLL